MAFSIAAGFLSLASPSAQAYPQGPEALDSFGAYDYPTLNGPVQLVDQLNGNVVSQFPTEPSSDSADDPFANSEPISAEAVRPTPREAPATTASTIRRA